MENIGEENKEDFLHDLRILYLNIFYLLRALVAVSLYWFYFLNIGKISQKVSKNVPQ